MGRKSDLQRMLSGVVDAAILRPLVWLRLRFEERYKMEIGGHLIKNLRHSGKGVRFKGNIIVTDWDKLKIGSYSSIGDGAYFYTRGGLEIGENCQVSRNVTIYTGNHNYRSALAIPYDDGHVVGKVTIGHSVWIGMNSSILPGVTIGDGAVIGLGTVVSKDVPEGAICVGSSARLVGARDMVKFNELKENGAFFGSIWPEL